MPRLVNPSLLSFPGNDAIVSPGPSRERQRGSASVKLVCLSPDGRSVHSLAFISGMAYIESRPLPLPDSSEKEDIGMANDRMPALILTKLPERVQAALRQYPPLELLCVDVESRSSHKDTPNKLKDTENIPLLCLYTKKDVFVLKMIYAPMGRHSSEVEGEVASVREPFDKILLGTATSTSIIRIRPAPQRHMGHATICPPECMAMLTHNSETNEYCLHLHQENAISTPLVYGMEQLDEQYEHITDFCFGQSRAFPLLSSISVLLLKGTGDAMMASPIVFRGTVVLKQSVTSSLDFLEAELGQLEASSAKFRQYRCAKQFLLDAFPEDGRGDYTTAQVRTNAFEWPVQVQGPVLVAAESENYEPSFSAHIIEPFPAGELLGVAIGREGDSVDFGILSPTIVIPRFRFESEDDTVQLDNDLKWGPIVQRVDFSTDEDEYQSISALISDPVMDTILHCVSPTGIRSISTTVMKVVASQILEQSGDRSLLSPNTQRRSKDTKPRTTSWSCVDVSNSNMEGISVSGAVISSDVHLGHVLISRLSDGSMVTVNLTETRHFHEMEALADANERYTPSKSSNVTDQALMAMQESKGLHELLDPLIRKVSEGLGSMGKIVGSSTPTKEITPDLLAVALSVKERCDNEIALPLIEMSEVVGARRKELEAALKNQTAQLQSLKASIDKLKEGMASILETAEVARNNAKSLAGRSTSALQSGKDLLPTITQAEFDYMEELKRLDSKTKSWQEDFNLLDAKVSKIHESIDGGTANNVLQTLAPETIKNCGALLEGSSRQMQMQKEKLKTAQIALEEIVFDTGLDLGPEKSLSSAQ